MWMSLGCYASTGMVLIRILVLRICIVYVSRRIFFASYRGDTALRNMPTDLASQLSYHPLTARIQCNFKLYTLMMRYNILKLVSSCHFRTISTVWRYDSLVSRFPQSSSQSHHRPRLHASEAGEGDPFPDGGG